MLEMCDLLLEHASDERRLADDPVTQAAAQRWIEVLGEAASHVSVELQKAFHIDQDIIGNVVTHHVPRLRAQLHQIYESLVDSDS
jgi:uncharacterized protein with HEPN domain